MLVFKRTVRAMENMNMIVGFFAALRVLVVVIRMASPGRDDNPTRPEFHRPNPPVVSPPAIMHESPNYVPLILLIAVVVVALAFGENLPCG